MELPNVTDSIILVIAVAKISLSVDEKYDSERSSTPCIYKTLTLKKEKYIYT